MKDMEIARKNKQTKRIEYERDLLECKKEDNKEQMTASSLAEAVGTPKSDLTAVKQTCTKIFPKNRLNKSKMIQELNIDFSTTAKHQYYTLLIDVWQKQKQKRMII